MSRKRNITKEMFQPTTECVDSLTIDDVTGRMNVLWIRNCRHMLVGLAGSQWMSWPRSWKCDIISKSWLLWSMHIYLKNITGVEITTCCFYTPEA